MEVTEEIRSALLDGVGPLFDNGEIEYRVYIKGRPCVLHFTLRAIKELEIDPVVSDATVSQFIEKQNMMMIG